MEEDKVYFREQLGLDEECLPVKVPPEWRTGDPLPPCWQRSWSNEADDMDLRWTHVKRQADPIEPK